MKGHGPTDHPHASGGLRSRPFLDELRARMKGCAARLAFPEATDPRVLAAVRTIVEEELAHPILVGPGPEVTEACSAAGLDPVRVEIVDLEEPGGTEHARTRLEALRPGLAELELAGLASDPLVRAALLVEAETADGAVAGAVRSTSEVLRAGIRWIGLAEGFHSVSSSFYMVVPPFRGADSEVLTFTDAAVVPAPTPVQLAEIALAAAEARRPVVGDEPRVAFLSYSTKGSAAGPEVERVTAALEHFRTLAPGIPADGELQGDAALIEEVAARKAPESSVAGRANVLVFPDLDAGNLAYKLVERLARATAIGPVVQGLRRPFNDLSRGASAEDVVHVSAVTALMARR